MAWIESHQELARHPKTLRAAKRLGVSRVTIIGHLHYLWWWCLDYAADGDLSEFTEDEIAEAAEWDGDGDAFVCALVQSGFIDRDGDRLTIHDNDQYNGKLKRQREDNRDRQRRFRDSQKPVTEPVTVTSPLSNRDVTPLHNTTVQNTTSSSSSISGAPAREIAREDDVDDDDDLSPIDDGFTPTYPATLGKHWPVAVGIFTDLFPAMPPPTIEAMLGDVERDVGPLTRKQLQTGLDAVQDCLKRANGSITHVRPYVRKVVTEKLREVANVHA